MFTVLIIDDDPLIRLILKKALQEQGYSVVVAQRGEEGIEKAQQLRPALIICDWEMSGISGLEVCHFIKTHPNLSSTFFILLTARSAIVDRVKGLDTGADDFLLKPIEGSELRARVKAGLRLYQANQELQKLAENLQAQQRLLEAELAEASDYLRSLLPNPLIGNVTIDFRFLPSRQLGGDCFDYYWLDSDYLMIYLLDVSGHGLRAALPSVSIQNLLRTQSLQGTNFYQPSSVLKALNDVLQMENHEDQYFTIWYGVYNQKKRQLFYASAGHPPAILISQNEAKLPQVRQLKTRGCAIGMFPDTKYVSERCEVDESSTLYIFSDGIYEITQANGTILGLEKFTEILTNYTLSSNDDLSVLLQKVMYLNQNHVFEDDCSLLQIKLT
jgi:sigma-B regulation protein RsbU (phosphoserine phosphatase)